MRERTYRAIKEAVEAVIAQQVGDARRVILRRIEQSDEVTVPAITAIQPAAVELTQEMADDIVRKIHGPLTINREFSEWIAEQGKFHELFYQFPIGYGSDAGRGNLRLKGDGSMTLQIEDRNGASLWRGTFVPADYGKAPYGYRDNGEPRTSHG